MPDPLEEVSGVSTDDTATQLTGLKRRRGGNIGYLKKIFDEVTTLTSRSNSDEDVQVTLVANKEILEENERALKAYHEEIISLLVNEDDISHEIAHHTNATKEVSRFI